MLTQPYARRALAGLALSTSFAACSGDPVSPEADAVSPEAAFISGPIPYDPRQKLPAPPPQGPTVIVSYTQAALDAGIETDCVRSGLGLAAGLHYYGWDGLVGDVFVAVQARASATAKVVTISSERVDGHLRIDSGQGVGDAQALGLDLGPEYRYAVRSALLMDAPWGFSGWFRVANRERWNTSYNTVEWCEY